MKERGGTQVAPQSTGGNGSLASSLYMLRRTSGSIGHSAARPLVQACSAVGCSAESAPLADVLCRAAALLSVAGGVNLNAAQRCWKLRRLRASSAMRRKKTMKAMRMRAHQPCREGGGGAGASRERLVGCGT